MSRPVFRKYGRFEQLQIETLEDLERLDALDEARWTATSVPVEQLVADPALLAYLDSDNNGRIRVNEIREARRWLWARLRRRERVLEGSDTLLLDDLDPTHEDVVKVRDLARLLLEQLGAAARDRIELGQARSFKAIYMARFPNGDGVVSLKQILDEGVAELAREVLASTGGATDLSGEPGVRAQDLDLYLERIEAFVRWCARREGERSTLFPLGEETAAAAAVVAGLTAKMDQFFAQCALVALEAGASARLQASPEELARLDVTNPVAILGWLEQAPLARPAAEGVLRLDGPLNPHFKGALDRLASEIGPRLLGREGPLRHLDAGEWSAVRAALAPFVAWRDGRPAGIPADADPARLSAWIGSPAAARLRALAAEDLGVADELMAFNTLERLLLYQQWLLLVVNNVVSMPDLFEPHRRTLFQRGTLILDGRRLDLCVKVTDIAAHKKIAESSLIFLAYVKIFRKEGAEERSELLAAAVTSDVRGGIALDKRGVFYDRDGNEWDAIIVDIVAQPISVREAMIQPFLRIRDQVTARLQKTLESAASDAETRASGAADQATGAATATGSGSTTGASAPAAGGGLQGLLVGGSVAIAAVGSSAAFILKTISDLSLWSALSSTLLVVGGLAALFGLLGWLKLRRRDVSALLEACGWALNCRMRLVFPLATLFTRRPDVPQGALVRHHVPRGRTGLLVVALAAVLALAAWVVTVHPAWVFATPPAPPDPPIIPEAAAPASP